MNLQEKAELIARLAGKSIKENCIKMKVFPIYLNSGMHYDNIYCDPVVEKIWVRIKPKDLSWYAVDGILKSENEIEIVVYDMRDLCYGGIGEEIHRETVKGFTEDERKELHKRIHDHKLLIAAEEYEARKKAAKKKAILKIYEELFPE